MNQRIPFLSKVQWLLLSVRISAKVLGIGLLVAALFGTITLFITSRSMSRTMYRVLEERTQDGSEWLAFYMERPLATGDLASVQQKISQVMTSATDIRYIIVRDRSGQILAHTFSRAVPEDLARWNGIVPEQYNLEVFESKEGLIFHTRHPILGGHAGVLEIGVSDKRVVGEVSSLVSSVLMALFFSILLGTALGLLLTHLLTKPIHSLVQTTHRLSKGDFTARAKVFSADEIGKLASAFNHMTETLQVYRLQVEEKERARLRLVDGVVQAQEEERKTIARELHDHLGQSLTGLLLTIQSRVPAEQMPESVRNEIVMQIRRLSSEVHQLAWGLRPPTLDDYGLDSVLSSYLEDLPKSAGLQVEYQYAHPEPPARLPTRVEVTLYRVAQEAITNTMRHASASHISVVLIHQQEDVTLIVEDDGQGFDPGRVSLDRLGLTGMKERVALLGGICIVESEHGNGATVWVRIPVHRDPSCQSAS